MCPMTRGDAADVGLLSMSTSPMRKAMSNGTARRSGTQSWYPFGNVVMANDANYGYNLDRTTPVGNYPRNGFSLYDMTANTAQGVQDCHQDDYVGAPSDGSAWMTGPCELCNVRSGGWSRQGWSVRVARRIGDPPAMRNDHLGFRTARDLVQPKVEYPPEYVPPQC